MLVCRPDAVRDDVIYELKVQRLKSDREKMMLYAWCQLQLEMHILGFRKGAILIYHYADGRVEEIEVAYSPEASEELPNSWRKLYEHRVSAGIRLRMLQAQSLSLQASA